MAGHLLFNSGSNESSLAPQLKWLDNTFNGLLSYLFAIWKNIFSMDKKYPGRIRIQLDP